VVSRRLWKRAELESADHRGRKNVGLQEVVVIGRDSSQGIGLGRVQSPPSWNSVEQCYPASIVGDIRGYWSLVSGRRVWGSRDHSGKMS
jgi:hypothetical protein